MNCREFVYVIMWVLPICAFIIVFGSIAYFGVYLRFKKTTSGCPICGKIIKPYKEGYGAIPDFRFDIYHCPDCGIDFDYGGIIGMNPSIPESDSLNYLQPRYSVDEIRRFIRDCKMEIERDDIPPRT
jgi:hypothetical protein